MNQQSYLDPGEAVSNMIARVYGTDASQLSAISRRLKYVAAQNNTE
jgi:hypothetical protein